jgi:transketolase
LDTEEKAFLEARARSIRRRILSAIYAAQTGHEGPSLSMVEILTVLYFKHLRYDPRYPRDPGRDRLIVSKGHGAPGLYAALAEASILPGEELLTLRRLGSRLQGHPNARVLPGVDVSTGSLGQGLSIAVGMALGFQLSGVSNRVYCILGDGELQEGQSWEAAMAAAKLRLDRLVAIVDRNGLQGDGHTEIVMPLLDIAAKWAAFGWAAEVVDGHSVEALDQALARGREANGRPLAIVAETVKGKGVSFMEGVLEWHHQPLDDAHYRAAMAELEERSNDIATPH